MEGVEFVIMPRENSDYINLWIRETTYKNLLKVRAILDKEKKGSRNSNDVIVELIKFWKENRGHASR